MARAVADRRPRRSTGGDVPGSISRPACSAARRNDISDTWVASHALQYREKCAGSAAVTRCDTSPFTSGFVTIARSFCTIVRNASRTGAPASRSGFAAW